MYLLDRIFLLVAVGRIELLPKLVRLAWLTKIQRREEGKEREKACDTAVLQAKTFVEIRVIPRTPRCFRPTAPGAVDAI